MATTKSHKGRSDKSYKREKLKFWLRLRKWKESLDSLIEISSWFLLLKQPETRDSCVMQDILLILYSPTTASSSFRVHWTIDLLTEFFKLYLAESDATFLWASVEECKWEIFCREIENYFSFGREKLLTLWQRQGLETELLSPFSAQPHHSQSRIAMWMLVETIENSLFLPWVRTFFTPTHTTMWLFFPLSHENDGGTLWESRASDSCFM